MLRTAFAGALLVAGFAVVSCDGDGNKADANGKVKSDTALGKEFWLVRPMYFTTLHWSEDGAEHRDCFVDSDEVVRLPYGLTSAETVTHWAELPTLPGGMTHAVLGEDVQPALQNVWGAHPLT
ncbi:hypothetical protein SAMN06272775_0174 [Streptomyces sp. 2323.1]|uniref:AQJ64_40280 family protein n=1 Tax=Streptomyces sp. 2323.1 TaxID=1938841 RepID=UPI000BC08142|nr:AQJ64_40280 family protein [Streptomyces sp. 2323.1]SOE09090.1 hypothetical protein SAMN06272775_0174 [Streptomyces sp. 2323.1]